MLSQAFKDVNASSEPLLGGRKVQSSIRRILCIVAVVFSIFVLFVGSKHFLSKEAALGDEEIIGEVAVGPKKFEPSTDLMKTFKNEQLWLSYLDDDSDAFSGTPNAQLVAALEAFAKNGARSAAGTGNVRQTISSPKPDDAVWYRSMPLSHANQVFSGGLLPFKDAAAYGGICPDYSYVSKPANGYFPPKSAKQPFVVVAFRFPKDVHELITEAGKAAGAKKELGGPDIPSHKFEDGAISYGLGKKGQSYKFKDYDDSTSKKDVRPAVGALLNPLIKSDAVTKEIVGLAYQASDSAQAASIQAFLNTVDTTGSGDDSNTANTGNSGNSAQTNSESEDEPKKK